MVTMAWRKMKQKGEAERPRGGFLFSMEQSGKASLTEPCASLGKECCW